MNSAVNYEMVKYVKGLLGSGMEISDVKVHNKWLVCTLTSKDIKMASYKNEPRLAVSMEFKVRNY